MSGTGQEPPRLTHVLATPSKSRPNLEAIIDCKQYSNLIRLLHMTAYVFRISRTFKQLNTDNPSTGIQLNSEDLQHAVGYVVFKPYHLVKS